MPTLNASAKFSTKNSLMHKMSPLLFAKVVTADNTLSMLKNHIEVRLTCLEVRRVFHGVSSVNYNETRVAPVMLLTNNPTLTLYHLPSLIRSRDNNP